ncbi:MAG: DUF975 family protein [Gammaproteobacteria bacterium]|nr:DUF975 family protein [Gammaproteobacteria bacterium]MDH3534438.1 DUF975 family protein [Gammaproteobacteria bacterium]
MADIYATPEADLAQGIEADRAGGNIDDAVAGNFQVNMLETLGEAWRGLKGFKLKCHIALALYFLVFLGVAIAFGALTFVLAQSGADQSVIEILGFVFQIAITIVALPMGFAIMIMALRHANQKSVSAGEIFRHFDVIGSLFVAYLIQTIFVVIGLLLLVLPGIYLMFAYMYAMPLIVEKKMGPWQALETSRKTLTRVWFRFFGLMLLITLINLLGAIPLGLGWIWTIPWSVLAMAMVYQKIYGVEAHTLSD